MVEVTRADQPGTLGQLQHRSGNPLGDVGAEPRRRDQNHQGRHQEEREIDTCDGSRQHAQLVVGTKRAVDPPGMRRQLTGEHVAHHHHTHHRPVASGTDDRRSTQQFRPITQWLGRRALHVPGGETGRESVGRGARVPGRQERIGDLDEPRGGCLSLVVDLDHINVHDIAAADGTLLGHDVPQGCFGYPRQVHSRQSRRQTPGAVLRRLLLVLIDATRDRVR